MARRSPRASSRSRSIPRGGESAIVIVEEARGAGVPESSLLFATATSWDIQAVDGQRNGAHRGIPEDERVGAPTGLSISTTYDRNVTLSVSGFNLWPAPAPPLSRSQAQVSPFSAQFQRTPASSARPSQIRPGSELQLIFSIDEARATTTAASTHLLAPPSAPPALRRRAPIPLPSLSPLTPIQIHPLMSSHSSPRGPDAPIYWNICLPPSTARLAAALGGLAAPRWSCEVAVEPRTLTSLAVRIAGVERPVVVFPAEIGHPIRIVDVLRAVYGAVCRAAVESAHSRVVGDISAGSSASVAVATADAIRRHFCGGVWWGGLYESTSERDVWILALQGPGVGAGGEP